MAIIKGAISFGSNFNIGAKGPIDSRMRVETKTDLTTAWTEDIPAFKGMSVVTMDTGKIWVLIDEDYTNESNWKEPSPKPVIDATNYTDAKSKATTENIGQIVNVADKETSDGKEYTSGLYVVTGNNEVAKLGTTSASGDLAGDVTALQGRVGDLENKVSTLNGDENTEGSVKKQIKAAKEALESEIKNVKAAHTVVSGATGNTHVTVETNTDESGKQTVTITEDDIASKTALVALTEKVGNEASGDTTATGVFKYVDDKVNTIKVPEYSITKDDNGVFHLTKDKANVGESISFKDYMVRSGSVVIGDWADTGKTTFNESETGKTTAIKLVLNVKNATGEDASETIYIDATSLVDTYTVAKGSEDYLTINGYTISLSDTAISNISKVPTIESELSVLTETVNTNNNNALKEIKVNDQVINSGKTAIVLTGEDIKTKSDIKVGEDVIVSANTAVDTVLSGIYSRIKELDGSKVASVTANEKSGVVVTTTEGNAEISLDLERATDTTVAEGHIEIKVNDNGELYGVMYYNEGIPEKTTPENPTE